MKFLSFSLICFSFFSNLFFFQKLSLAKSNDQILAPFTIGSKSLENIPYKHFEYLEGYDHNTTFKELKKGSWKKNLKNYQSIVDGYWIRFKILNNFNTNEIGLFHNWNTEKKVFTDFNGLEKMYSYWNFETDAWIDDGRVLDKYKILLPKNEVTIVYNYFRNNPLDRYMGKTNGLDRIGIGTWETVRFQQYLSILSNIATISIVFSFALYYLFMFIVSKGPYIWLSLSLFQLSILSTTNLVIGKVLSIDRWVYHSEFSLCQISILFILLLQFFRSSMNLRITFPKVDKIYIFIIIFYLLMVIINFFTSLNWPTEKYIDLVNYPPDRGGPGIIQMKFLTIPFLLLLLTSAILSYKLWKKGSKYSKYLFVSFLLPFLSVPVSLISYLILDFTWVTWFIISSSVGVLFIAMFITFGFAVAQQLNDMKNSLFEQQVKLTKAYQRFVPKQLLEYLGKDSILDVKLGDQVSINMSILFADIRSFTSISEKMSPEENFKFVNSYLNNIGPLIRKNNGYIDKFMGDGVMALFKTSEKDAIIAAIEMHKSLNSYNQKSSINGQDPIKIGIGINTGKMMLGTLGESNRMEGSVISDAVNIASRLESLTKVYKSDILISEDTKKKIKQKNLFTRFVDIVKVKGKSESFSIYEVVDSNSSNLYKLKKDTIKDFEKGIEHYHNKKFKNAAKLFNKIFDINPDDHINFLYKSRCENLLKKTTLIKNWSPIVEYSEK